MVAVCNFQSFPVLISSYLIFAQEKIQLHAQIAMTCYLPHVLRTLCANAQSVVLRPFTFHSNN